MEMLYIDESGSLTKNHCSLHEHFVIAVVHPINPKALKDVYKRFVSSRLEEFKKHERARKMFTANGKFKELKGNCFDRNMKKDFLSYFCQNDLFEVYYVVVHNKKTKTRLYENTARAFNYVLKLGLQYWVTKHLLNNCDFHMCLDERNEKTETKHFLENYLNTELYVSCIINGQCTVQYFDSKNNIIIQIADVFANIMFSELKTNGFTEELEQCSRYIRHTFHFPLY